MEKKLIYLRKIWTPNGLHLVEKLQVKEVKALITLSPKNPNKTKERFEDKQEKINERKLNQFRI